MSMTVFVVKMEEGKEEQLLKNIQGIECCDDSDFNDGKWVRINGKPTKKLMKRFCRLVLHYGLTVLNMVLELEFMEPLSSVDGIGGGPHAVDFIIKHAEIEIVFVQESERNSKFRVRTC